MSRRADELDKHIAWAIDAHKNYAKKKEAVRFWDGETPYFIHPLWSAMMILSETELPREVRWEGAVTLLYHDVLEDTTKGLPKSLSGRVRSYIDDMTFYGGIDEEMEKVWEKADEIILYKLYDKASNLMDCIWMKGKVLEDYVDYSEKLKKKVVASYGELHITKLANYLIGLRRR